MKDFDILDHEWSDDHISIDKSYKGDELSFDTYENYPYFFIDKQDAIAIAKHFGLTKEDLE